MGLQYFPVARVQILNTWSVKLHPAIFPGKDIDNSVVRQIPSNPSQYLLRNFSKSSSRAKGGGHCLCGYNVSLLVLSDISSFFQIINSWFVMVCLSASVTRKTLFHTRRFLWTLRKQEKHLKSFLFLPNCGDYPPTDNSPSNYILVNFGFSPNVILIDIFWLSNGH